MANVEADWKALARAVKARREGMRLPQDLSSRGGPGEITVRKIERAEQSAIRNKTKTQLEAALSASEGWVDRILNGTATEDDLDPNKRFARAGNASGTGAAHAALGGLTATAGGQVIRPEGIPSQAQVGEPTVTVHEKTGGAVVHGAGSGIRDAFDRRPLIGEPTVVLVSELLERLNAEEGRSADADAALDGLRRLLPELFPPAVREAMQMAGDELARRGREGGEK